MQPGPWDPGADSLLSGGCVRPLLSCGCPLHPEPSRLGEQGSEGGRAGMYGVDPETGMFILSVGPQAPAGVGSLPSRPVGLSHSLVCASESGPGRFVLGPSLFLWGGLSTPLIARSDMV